MRIRKDFENRKRTVPSKRQRPWAGLKSEFLLPSFRDRLRFLGGDASVERRIRENLSLVRRHLFEIVFHLRIADNDIFERSRLALCLKCERPHLLVRVWVSLRGEDDVERFGNHQTFLHSEVAFQVGMVNGELFHRARESFRSRNYIGDNLAISPCRSGGGKVALVFADLIHEYRHDSRRDDFPTTLGVLEVDGVSLLWHSRGTDLRRFKRFTHFSDFCPLEISHVIGQVSENARRDCDFTEEARQCFWRHDLCRVLRWCKSQLGEHFRLETFGVIEEQRGGVIRPHRSRKLTRKFYCERLQCFDGTAKTADVSGEREAERNRNRVLAVSSADLHCFRFAERDVDERSFQLCERRNEHLPNNVLVTSGVRRINDVVRGRRHMDVRLHAFADFGAYAIHERTDVVANPVFFFVHFVGRHLTASRLNFSDGDFGTNSSGVEDLHERKLHEELVTGKPVLGKVFRYFFIPVPVVNRRETVELVACFHIASCKRAFSQNKKLGYSQLQLTSFFLFFQSFYGDVQISEARSA